MEAVQISEILQKKIAFLSGGQDRNNCPIITFPAHGDEEFPQQEIIACISYLKNILSDECGLKEFTIIIDLRNASWKHLKLLLKVIQQSVGDNISNVYIIKPEHFWDKQKISLDIKKGKTDLEFEPIYLGVHKLMKYVSKINLTPDFGGILHYDHQKWLKIRLEFEKFNRKAISLMKNMDGILTKLSSKQMNEDKKPARETLIQHQLMQNIVSVEPVIVIQEGTDLLKRLLIDADSGFHNAEYAQSQPVDTLIVQTKIRLAIKNLNFKHEKLQTLWERKQRELKCEVEFCDLENGMKEVIDWIVGPAKKLLASQNDIGDCLQTAEECLKQHEHLEFMCSGYLSSYKKLCNTAESFITERYFARKAIQDHKKYMDTTFRDFVRRLEIRRELLMNSVNFFDSVEQFSKQMDNLIELLCCDVTVNDIESAENALIWLAIKYDAITCLVEKIQVNGHTLLSLLSHHVRSAAAANTEISSLERDQIQAIQKVIDNLNERKTRAGKLVDVRQLKLQQILQLKTCEYDTDQAILWMLELHEVLIKTHTDIGKDLEEAEILKIEYNKFKETVVNTYEYGKQLLHSAVVLRRACRQDLSLTNEREQRLQEAWGKLSTALDRREIQLNSKITFFRDMKV